MWNLKYDTKELFYEIENRFVVAKDTGRGTEWECGISKCKLLHTEWGNNKVLLYGTGNYTYAVINYNGKKYEKECIYTYNWITLQKKLIQHCKSTRPQ